MMQKILLKCKVKDFSCGYPHCLIQHFRGCDWTQAGRRRRGCCRGPALWTCAGTARGSHCDNPRLSLPRRGRAEDSSLVARRRRMKEDRLSIGNGLPGRGCVDDPWGSCMPRWGDHPLVAGPLHGGAQRANHLSLHCLRASKHRGPGRTARAGGLLPLPVWERDGSSDRCGWGGGRGRIPRIPALVSALGVHGIGSASRPHQTCPAALRCAANSREGAWHELDSPATVKQCP
mmetsp:Transcript_8226/g.14710  ORF Transcript_8226/g.14710 Transcript_8226/m.14710 type:complete len:232 (+) Transcript_8226:2113-2808(+)